MLTICSECRVVLGETPEEPEKISHGLCPSCFEAAMADFEQNHAPKEEPNAVESVC